MGLLDFILVIFSMLVLITCHELGHVIAAKLLGLVIKEVGFAWKPYPQAFVAVEWTDESFKRYIYLFGGTIMTLLLFFITYGFQFFHIRVLPYAFAFQLILETNPFYSDFMLAMVTHRMKNESTSDSVRLSYQQMIASHSFSFRWYVHFMLWCLFIIFITRLNIYSF